MLFYEYFSSRKLLLQRYFACVFYCILFLFLSFWPKPSLFNFTALYYLLKNSLYHYCVHILYIQVLNTLLGCLAHYKQLQFAFDNTWLYFLLSCKLILIYQLCLCLGNIVIPVSKFSYAKKIKNEYTPL